MLVLEGAQAGLSWLTILRRRESYRKAFHGFDPERIARFEGSDLERLLADTGIVRNRRKLEAAIGNARALLDGFTFVGSTICYAFMQAVGMVNDHTVDCFRYRELAGGGPHAPRSGSAGAA
jgi:DNA-3-methyladenine glycosylase I